MITINAILKAKPDRESLLLEELKKMVHPSCNEEGCIDYKLHQSLQDSGTFVFYETWENEEALRLHMETDHYKSYRKNIANLLDVREVYRLEEVLP
ncbi:putative quinol monooxygenase [Peribacillus muralis]|uniref:putative quinol monooxygenase n=1 Tax=Peribacillus muralis TaxID=264697 RepID=UPI003671CE48